MIVPRLGAHKRLSLFCARTLRAADALARAAGNPYDPDRIEIFETLFTALRQPFPHITDPAKAGVSASHLAFFESYFSNYIEGVIPPKK